MAKVAILDPGADTMHVDERSGPESADARATAESRGAPVRTVTEVQRCASGSTLLAVTSYDGRLEIVRIPGEPDADARDDELPPGCRPLAVRFELDTGGPRCTCVVSSGKGPRRVGLSIPAALALVAGGVHGIVTSVRPRATQAVNEER